MGRVLMVTAVKLNDNLLSSNIHLIVMMKSHSLLCLYLREKVTVYSLHSAMLGCSTGKRFMEYSVGLFMPFLIMLMVL